MISVINYGGKITDDMDNILINTILEKFLNKNNDNNEFIYFKKP